MAMTDAMRDAMRRENLPGRDPLGNPMINQTGRVTRSPGGSGRSRRGGGLPTPEQLEQMIATDLANPGPAVDPYRGMNTHEGMGTDRGGQQPARVPGAVYGDEGRVEGAAGPTQNAPAPDSAPINTDSDAFAALAVSLANDPEAQREQGGGVRDLDFNDLAQNTSGLGVMTPGSGMAFLSEGLPQPAQPGATPGPPEGAERPSNAPAQGPQPAQPGGTPPAPGADGGPERPSNAPPLPEGEGGESDPWSIIPDIGAPPFYDPEQSAQARGLALELSLGLGDLDTTHRRLIEDANLMRPLMERRMRDQMRSKANSVAGRGFHGEGSGLMAGQLGDLGEEHAYRRSMFERQLSRGEEDVANEIQRLIQRIILEGGEGVLGGAGRSANDIIAGLPF